jgi:calcineurin-like phosphoesterase family protein
VTIFFTADTHFGHVNIVDHGHRAFDDIYHMNETIIQNWNAVVRPGDRVYHLGDFGWWTGANLEELFYRLRGHKHLVRGNHDDKRVQSLPWAWVKDIARIRVEGQRIILSHFPFRTWWGRDSGAWHLFGHLHSYDGAAWGRSVDVGVDAWNFQLVSFETLREFFLRRGHG